MEIIDKDKAMSLPEEISKKGQQWDESASANDGSEDDEELIKLYLTTELFESLIAAAVKAFLEENGLPLIQKAMAAKIISPPQKKKPRLSGSHAVQDDSRFFPGGKK